MKVETMHTNIVGRQALKIALAISLGLIALSFVTLFAYGYHRQSVFLEHEIQNLREAETSGIIEGMWNYDNKLLQALADGFGFHPYINYVVIEDTKGPIVERGAPKEGSQQRAYPLTRKAQNGKELVLGKLRIEIDTPKILSDALSQVLSSLVFQVFFLVVESFIVLFLFQRMVTRHLVKIAAYLKEHGGRPGAPTLSLDKKDSGDELDILVQSFNAMRSNLEAARGAEEHAIEELKRSEEVNRILVEEAPDAIMMFDYDRGYFISGNRRAEEYFGRPRQAFATMRPSEVYTPIQPDGLPVDESVAESTARAIAGEPVLIRRSIARPNGEILTCEVRITAIPSVDRKILRVSYIDITDRARAEEEIAKSLREKETLLQEVYHRTKNNMQLIAAFLNMEALASRDERMRGIINEMIGRITSMALVHQKLYESKDLSRIDLGRYLEDLVQEIRSAHLEKRPGIKIEVSAEAGIISVLDTAIPCGLALNELIVNSIKHAFPGGRTGTIRVGLFRGEPGILVLSVADDGVGFPAGFDFRNDGRIGLQTVVSLVEGQLHGTISCESGRGTICTATIRDNIYAPRV